MEWSNLCTMLSVDALKGVFYPPLYCILCIFSCALLMRNSMNSCNHSTSRWTRPLASSAPFPGTGAGLVSIAHLLLIGPVWF